MDDIAIPVSTEIELTPVMPRVANPRVWTVFVVVVLALVLAVVFQVILAVVLVVVEAARGGDVQKFANELAANMMTPEMFIATAGCGQLAFALGAILPGWLSLTPMRQRLGLLPPRQPWRVVPLLMLGSWAPLAVGIGLASLLALVVEPPPIVEQIFENITPQSAVAFVLFIALVPGFVEELLFRGYVQRRLLERWTPGLAIVVTSALFALVHVQPHHVVLAFPIGLWLGLVAWKSGSVYPSMLCHAFINGSLNAWRVVVKFGEVPDTTNQAVLIVGMIVGFVCFVFSVNCFIEKDEAALEGRPVGPFPGV